MSGGSYNYLCRQLDSRRADAALADDIRRMGQRLEDSGYADAAAATRAVVQLAESLSDVWQAVEWADSGDWDEEQVAEAVAAWLAKDQPEAATE